MSLLIDRRNDFVILKITGDSTIDDLYGGVDALYVSEPPKRVLWDFREARIPADDNSAGLMREFSAYAAERGKGRFDSRVAIVAPQDVQFGMARMSESLAEVNQSAYTMQVFRDYQAALDWLEVSD